MGPSKDPYREKELSTSPLGPMEPEILEKEMEKAKSKILNRVTGGAPTYEFLLWLVGFYLLMSFFRWLGGPLEGI